jgi:Tfp pilus assembly protein PilV
MRPLPSRDRRRSPLPRSEEGFSLIEVLVAALVLTVGILGLVGAFDSARKLTLLSERRSAMAHIAQLELERLQSYPYSQLAMASAPAHSSEKSSPDYDVAEGAEPTYQYGAVAGETESLVVAAKECASTTETGCGWVAVAPSARQCSTTVGACEWTDGQVSGRLYDFVTWHTDKSCGAKCPAKEDYKRLTVVATEKVPSGTHEPSSIRVSTLVAESP